jgi:hypothetical protein
MSSKQDEHIVDDILGMDIIRIRMLYADVGTSEMRGEICPTGRARI